MRFNIAWLILLSFLSVSCTEKAEPIRRHETAPRSSTAEVSISERPEALTPSQDSEQWKIKASSSKDVLKDILLPLSESVLSEKRLSDPSSMTSRSVMDELAAFNLLIIQLNPKDRARPEFNQIMKSYLRALTWECGSFAESCKGLRYFKLSSNSIQVVKLMSQLDEKNRYKLLLFAIKLKNSNWDQELVSLLFSEPTKTVSESDSEYQEAVRSMMGTALQTASQKFNDKKDVRDFLDSIHAWKLTGEEIRKFELPTRNALYSMIAKASYFNDADGVLHPDFKILLKNLESSPDSLLSLQKKLMKDGLLSPELIGAQQLTHYDELYFIIESVFKGEMESGSAAELFVSSKRSASELASAIRNYVRLRFMLALNESTDMAIKLFNADVQAQDLVFHYMKESTGIRTVWSGFISKILPLQTFAMRSLSQRANSEAQEREMRSLFSSTHRSINMSSAYPHTLILFHILSQKRFELKIPGTFGTFNTGDLMNALFLGQIGHLQDYSDEKTPFDQFQLVYAFDMAVRTGLFQRVKVDPDYFITDTLRRLNGKAIDEIDTTLNATKTRLASSPTFVDFKSACAELEGRSTARREIPLMDLRASPQYGKLTHLSRLDIENTSTSISTGKGGLDKSELGIFYPDLRFTAMIEKARLDVGNNQRLARAMLESYMSALRKLNLSSEEIDKRTLLSRKALAEVEKRRVEVLKYAKIWHEELGKCYLKLNYNHYQSIIKTIAMEKAYLRQAHRDILRLRAGVTEAEKEKIEDRHRFHGLPGNFKGSNQISSSGLLYTQIDLLIRTAGYLTKGLVTERETFSPLAPQVDVYMGEDLDPGRSNIANTTKYFLHANDSEDDFVNSGIRVIINGYQANTNFVTWYPEGEAFLTNWSRFLASLTSLYRLERELTGENKYFTASTIWNVHEGYLSALKMTDDEKALQSLLMKTSKINIIFLNKRVVTTNDSGLIQGTLGLYDLPLIMMSNEQLGASWNDRDSGNSDRASARPGFFKTGQSYYQSRAKETRGQSIIPYNPELDQFLDKQVIGFVREELKAILEFNNLTKSYLEEVVAKLPAKDRPRADINVSLSITEPLMSDRLLPSFQYNVNNFNRSTSSCFVSDTKCAAFQQ